VQAGVLVVIVVGFVAVHVVRFGRQPVGLI
jgi:hypothetical protein